MSNFIFRVLAGADSRDCAPLYGESLAKVYSKPRDEQHYRSSLSGALKFIGSDFDYINDKPLLTEFKLYILQGHITKFAGKFSKYNCVFDPDNRSVEVKPEPLDQYTNLLKGAGKEYNLIKLLPEKSEIEIRRRPLIQLYIPGSKVVSCFVAGTYWEQEVISPVSSESDLVDKYRFALDQHINRITVTGSSTPDLAGDYDTTDGITFTSGNNTIVATKGEFATRVGIILTVKYSIRASGVEQYVTELYNGVPNSGRYYEGEIVFIDPSTKEPGPLSAFNNDLKVYARYMVDVMQVLGVDTHELPSPDILADNRNYNRVVGYQMGGIIISRETQTDPTEYGKSDTGEYFKEYLIAPSAGGGKCYPVGRSGWGFASTWFAFPFGNELLEDAGTSWYTLKDGTRISDVIKALLKKIDPTITHEATEEYSKFLYAETNPVSFAHFRLALTAKSNILAGEYDRPAERAPITLESIFKMLKDTCQCYWFIDENNKLRIEHISYFKRGGAYMGLNISVDLTTLIEPRTRKPWGFAANKYEFIKADMPEQIRFSWADEVTAAFEGSPIEIDSPLTQDGLITDINPGPFTSDIDYMLMNPQGINPDGFALMSIKSRVLESDFMEFTQENITSAMPAGTPFAAVKSDSANRVTSDLIKIDSKGGYLYNPVTGVGVFLTYYDKNGNYTGHYETWNYNSITLNSQGAYYVAITLGQGSAPWEITPQQGKDSGIHLETEGQQELTMYETDFREGERLRMQNGHLSWGYLQTSFWRWDLPAGTVRMNGETHAVTVNGTRKARKQKIKIPYSEELNPYELVKTSLGNGQIEKLSVNLTSNTNEIELSHDSE